MTLKTIISATAIGLSAVCALEANAISVESKEAGSLATLVANPDRETTLTVSGPINAADFQFINDRMPALTFIDLSKAKIEAYDGKVLATGAGVSDSSVVPAFAFFGSKASTILLPDDIKAIGRGAFGNSSITFLSIPATVERIESSAFVDCKRITGIAIPASVTSIGDYAFKDCSALKQVTINGAISAIEASTFAGCGALEKIDVPESVTSIGDNAFAQCKSLQTINFPAVLERIGEKAFYESGLTDANLSSSKSLNSIGSYAFALNTALTTVALPDRAIEFGSGVFFDDAALSAIKLPAAMTAIPSLMFKGNAALNKSDLLPAGITNIGDYALMGMTSAQVIKFPAALQSIGDGAMEDWTSLSTVYADELAQAPALGNDVWAGVDQSNVIMFVTDKAKSQFESADQWKEFTIRVSSTGIDEVTADEAAGSADVDFRFVGNHLVISSTGSPIVAVDIYDLSGRHRLGHRGEASPEVDIALNRLPQSAVVVVNATLANGAVAPLKIAL